MIEEEDLVSLDELEYGTKEGVHTFSGANLGKSWIDHIITRRKDVKHVNNLIISDEATNTSDHKAISLEIKITQRYEEIKNEHEKPNTNNYKKIDWNETRTILKYQENLKRKITHENLKKVELKGTESREQIQERMNMQLKKITKVLLETTNELENEIESMKVNSKRIKSTGEIANFKN
jgi:hypothetical protein